MAVRLAIRVALAIILASPIAVGFWLAPKADDMPAPPELTAPPSVTTLPEAVRRALPMTAGDGQAPRPLSPPLSTGG
jgi:hypothetical protein